MLHGFFSPFTNTPREMTHSRVLPVSAKDAKVRKSIERKVASVSGPPDELVGASVGGCVAVGAVGAGQMYGPKSILQGAFFDQFRF